MKDFYFVYFPVGLQFINTMTMTFKYIPKGVNVVVITPTPELLKDVNVDFNLTVVNLDDISSDFSKEYEPVIREVDHELYVDQLKKDLAVRKRFPYSLPRHIIPWLLERDITKFALLDVDSLINFDGELEEVFARMQETLQDQNCFFGPHFIQNVDISGISEQFRDILEARNIEPSVLNDVQNPVTIFDGWLRGFWFNNKEYLQLYYDLWNSVLEKAFKTRYIDGQHNVWTVPDEWIISFINIIMNKKYGVIAKDVEFGGRRICKHVYHPENDYFLLHHEALYVGNFQLEFAESRKEFLQKNKEKLIRFYQINSGIPEDRVKELIYDSEYLNG